MKRRVSFLTVIALPCALQAQAGEIQLVSRAHPALLSETPGARTWLPDFFGRITSRDGRYVAFLSFATDLVPGAEDTNNAADLFLHDRVTQTTVLVSHAVGFPSRAAGPSAFAPSSVTMSADGRFVAYSNDAANLAAGQTPGATDLFLFDRVTATTTLVTRAVASPTGVATYHSYAAALSDDGRYLAFVSDAKLVSGQVTSGVSSLFLFDRLSGAIVLVSHPFGLPANGAVAEANPGCLSEDGQRLVFTSDAPNLVPGQLGYGKQVFLYDVPTDRLTLVSHSLVSPSIAANSVSKEARISGDGTRVSFSSAATDLIPGFTSGEPGRGSFNVYLYSIGSDSSRLVSHAASSAVVGGEEGSDGAEVSRDGRLVTFLSAATNLAGWQGTNGYVWDVTTGLSLVSRYPSGQAAGAGAISLSSDGNTVLFSSSGLLVPGQVNPDSSATLSQFLMELPSGRIALAAHAASSPLMSRPAARTALSGDGQTVVLESWFDDLVLGLRDFNARGDIFAYDVPTRTTSLISRVARPSRSAMGDSGAPWLSDPLMSRDGRYVTFAGNASNLFPGQAGQTYVWDLFQADRFTGAVRLVTHAVGDALRSTGGARPAAVSSSADGRVLVYGSEALLAPGATSTYPTHCYLWDRNTGDNSLIADDCSNEGVVQTPDARVLVYSSGAQLFRLDRATGVTELVSRRWGSPGVAGNGSSWAPTISSDGRWVAFSSTATDLVASGTAGTQVFLFDAMTGTNSLVSHRASSPIQEGNAVSYKAAVSADGSVIAYVSSATDLVAGLVDQQATDDVFLFDRTAGSNRLVSHSAGSLVTTTGTTVYDTGRPALSENGRFVVFNSYASNIVPGQSDTTYPTATNDEFLYDRLTEAIVLVSHSWSSETLSVGADVVVGLSSDGSKVLFTSTAGNVVEGQVNRGRYSSLNAFLYERVSATVSLLSGTGGSPQLTGNGRSGGIGLTPDGSVALLWSDADDLVSEDFNGASDVFVYVNRTPPPAGGQSFHTVSPCRLADTRLASGDWGGPAVSAGFDRSFVAVGQCGIPVTAKGLSVNVTVTGPTAPGNLRLFAGGSAPLASVINFTAGQTRANSAVAYLGPSGELTLRNDQPSGQVHVILDVNGYFE